VAGRANHVADDESFRDGVIEHGGEHRPQPEHTVASHAGVDLRFEKLRDRVES
jgi:hypothetical protein